jgi:hypothetical protein
MTNSKWTKPVPFFPFLERHSGYRTSIIHPLNHAPSTYLVGIIPLYLFRDLALAPFCFKDAYPGELEMVNGALDQRTKRKENASQRR